MTTIKDEDGLTPLIKLVATTNPKLLVNVSLALGRCAQDKETLIKIHELDGVRLIWSMLKNPSEEVRPLPLQRVRNKMAMALYRVGKLNVTQK